MAKISLGARTKTATPDLGQSGYNAGNWTVGFTPSDLAIHWSEYEVYKIVVNINTAAGVVPFTVWIDNQQYEGYQTNTIATWSDPQAMVVNSGATLYFYFTEPSADGTPPVVTIWIQIDDVVAKIEGTNY